MAAYEQDSVHLNNRNDDHQSTTPHSTTRSSVLENPELLELILLQLDLRSLIFAQRVCHRWHRATRSPALQEALFLRPEKTNHHERPEVNPLLMQYFPAWFAPHHQWKERYELETTSWTRDPAARDKFLRPEASWKWMLPVQPPPTELRIVTRMHQGQLTVRKGRLKRREELTVDKENIGDESEQAYSSPSLKQKRNDAAHRKEIDINMGLVYHLAQSYLRQRVVSYFCMIYPSQAQEVLDAQIAGMLPSSQLDPSVSRTLLSNEAIDAIKEEYARSNALVMVFEQLRNWFEPSDPTGDWLEEQNSIFARLNLRGWNGPVAWDTDAIEWDSAVK